MIKITKSLHQELESVAHCNSWQTVLFCHVFSLLTPDIYIVDEFIAVQLLIKATKKRKVNLAEIAREIDSSKSCNELSKGRKRTFEINDVFIRSEIGLLTI